MDNSLPSYFLGVCQDFKHFGFCVSVIIRYAGDDIRSSSMSYTVCPYSLWYCMYSESDVILIGVLSYEPRFRDG